MGGCQSTNHVESRNKTSPASKKHVSVKTARSYMSLDEEEEDNEQFKYHLKTSALEYWEPVNEIGEGSISSIHLVRRRPNRISVPYRDQVDIMSMASNRKPKNGEKLYALKSIIKSKHSNKVHKMYLKEMQNEIKIMSHLKHPNVAKVYEAYERKKHIYLVMEYCSGGTLRECEVDELQAAVIVRKVLSAVAYMHKNKIVHRDLKMENVLFDRPGNDAEIKVIDFGLSTRYLTGEPLSAKVGTLYSTAPQVLQGVYDFKCDIWSVGVIAYMLLCPGDPPFWGPNDDLGWKQREKVMIDRIMRCHYKPMEGGAWDNVSMDAKDFVWSLLQMNPEKRPTALQALELPWIKKYEGDTDTTVSLSLNFTTSDISEKEAVEEVQSNGRVVRAKRLSQAEITSFEARLESMDQILSAMGDDAESSSSGGPEDDDSQGDNEDLSFEEKLERMEAKLLSAVEEHDGSSTDDSDSSEYDADDIGGESLLSTDFKTVNESVPADVFVTAKDAIIPGGRINPGETPQYTYDEAARSLRRCVNTASDQEKNNQHWHSSISYTGVAP